MITAVGEEMPVEPNHTSGFQTVVIGIFNLALLGGGICLMYVLYQAVQDYINTHRKPPSRRFYGLPSKGRIPAPGGLSTPSTDGQSSFAHIAPSYTNRNHNMISNCSSVPRKRFGLPTSFANASPNPTPTPSSDVGKSDSNPPDGYSFPSFPRSSATDATLTPRIATIGKCLLKTRPEVNSNASATTIVAPQQMYRTGRTSKHSYLQRDNFGFEQASHKHTPKSYGLQSLSGDNDSRLRLYSLLDAGQKLKYKSSTSSGVQNFQHGGYNNCRPVFPSKRNASEKLCLGLPQCNSRCNADKNCSLEFLRQYNKALWQNDYDAFSIRKSSQMYY